MPRNERISLAQFARLPVVVAAASAAGAEPGPARVLSDRGRSANLWRLYPPTAVPHILRFLPMNSDEVGALVAVIGLLSQTGTALLLAGLFAALLRSHPRPQS